LRVLVVDDDPDSNEVVRTLLISCGADVRVAGSAADGLEELRRWVPDVLVSDIGMPGEDGYAFLRKVRAQRGDLAGVPAVALTAYATSEDRVRLSWAGSHRPAAKPIEPAELVTVVASAAHRLPDSEPG